MELQTLRNAGFAQLEEPLQDYESTHSSSSQNSIDLSEARIIRRYQDNLEPLLPTETAGTEGFNQDKDIEGPLHYTARLSCRTRMIGAFFIGLFLAICHHAFYSYLNGRSTWTASSSEWPIRIGTALSTLTRMFLGAAICEAYTQRVWTDLADQFHSIARIDTRFEATYGFIPFLELFFGSEVCSKPRVAVLLVTMLW